MSAQDQSEDMDIFDALPVSVRDALNAARFKFNPLDIEAIIYSDGESAALDFISKYVRRV